MANNRMPATLMLLGLSLLLSVAGCSRKSADSAAEADKAATGSAIRSGSVNMTPGLWEITSRMEMEALPVSIPPTTFTQCLTEENMVPKGDPSVSGCEAAQMRIDGDTITYNMKCSGDGETVVSSGTLTYRGTTMEGNVKISTSGQESTPMVARFTGKRLGPCQ